MTEIGILALVPLRGGGLPLGGAETVAEAEGSCWLVGSTASRALADLRGVARDVLVVGLGHFQPRLWAERLIELGVPEQHLLLPHSPDGRDLAPHLAAALGRPLISGLVQLEGDRATVARHGGLTMETLALDRPVVATFQLKARTTPVPDRRLVAHVAEVVLDPIEIDAVELIEELEADPATVDLADAGRIVAAGAGLGHASAMADVEAVAELLDASVGATRVVTDWGWISPERQIGTTGVAVDPELYLAVGISGAVQHTAGLGTPDHVIVVNVDGSCPMMELADLALVCDGPAFLTHLRSQLELNRTSANPRSRR